MFIIFSDLNLCVDQNNYDFLYQKPAPLHEMFQYK